MAGCMRFVAQRLDVLLDEPRPGLPRTIGDAAIAHVIARTLHEKRRNATHWSSCAMAIDKVRDIVQRLYMRTSNSGHQEVT